MIKHRIHELLATNGSIRAVINLGNPLLAWLANDGSLVGPSVRIATGIAETLGLNLRLVPVQHARMSFELLCDGKADLGFLAVDPYRAERLAFSDPYLAIEGGYIAPIDAELRTVGEVDRPSIRIAASRGNAYDLHLQWTIRHAAIVSTSSFDESLVLLRRGDADVAAGIRQAFSPAIDDGEWRILTGAFMEIRQAICIPQAKADAVKFLNDYVETLLKDRRDILLRV